MVALSLAPCLVLATLLGSCSRPAQASIPTTPNQVAVFERGVAAVRTGLTDLTDPSQLAMGIAGWATREKASSPWVWAVSQEASLWVVAPEDATQVRELVLQVRAPGFLAADFTLSARVNGRELGELPLDKGQEELVFALPADTCRAGLNRIELTGSHWESPKEHARGPDPRRLSFQFRSARLGAPGSSLLVRRLVPPVGAYLEGEWGNRLLVQGLADSSPVAPRVPEAFPARLGAVFGPGELALVYATTPGEATPDVRLGTDAGYTNLILIVIDTLRNDALDLVPTPNLDRLVAEGVRFPLAFANAPMTLPSHTSLFSSRLPSTTGLVNNGQIIPMDVPLLPSALGAEGYTTLGVVSIGTLWFVMPGTSLERSFAEYLSAGPLIPSGSATSALLAERVEAGALSEPFFLFAHFADPHEPYRDHGPGKNPVVLELDGEPFWSFYPKAGELLERDLELTAGEHRWSFQSPELEVGLLSFELRRDGVPVPVTFDAGGPYRFEHELQARFELDSPAKVHLRMWASDLPFGVERLYRYAGEVVAADAAVGQLIETLEAAGLWDSSLVVFTSDHGEGFAEHGYNGHVQVLFDEMLHVPLVIRPPLGAAWDPVRARLRADSAGLFPLTDLAPTMLALLGREPLPGSEGRSHLEPRSTGSVLLAETHRPEAERDLYCLRDTRWKLIFDPAAERFELFDLAADPTEHQNLFDERGAEFSGWCDQLRWRAQLYEQAPESLSDPALRADLDALGY